MYIYALWKPTETLAPSFDHSQTASRLRSIYTTLGSKWAGDKAIVVLNKALSVVEDWLQCHIYFCDLVFRV